MPICNLIECSSNYSEPTGSLWFYSKDKETNFNADVAANDDFKSFKYKDKLWGNTAAQPTPDAANGTLTNATILFFYQNFLYRHWRFTGQQGKGGDHLLFHSTTSTRSRTLRHLYETLHLIELPFEWLIDDAMFVCLLDELILGFCYSDLT